MKHLKLFAFPCVLVIVMTVLQFGAGVASAAPVSNCGQWKVAPSKNITSTSVLKAIAAVSTTDIWAVGYSAGANYNIQPLIEHWDGKTWQITPNPRFKNGAALYGITVLSANDIWAVGTVNFTGFGRGLTEHWNGVQWNFVPSVSYGVSTFLYGATAIANNDVWAVGVYTTTGNQSTYFSFAEHWNGANWSRVPTPGPNKIVRSTFAGISAINNKDIWAVGAGPVYDTEISTLAEHWDGSHWIISNSPNVGAISRFYGVSAVSTSDVWAVGESGDKGAQKALIENWNGTAWTISSSPRSTNGTVLNGVTALSANDVWAVGRTTNKGVTQTFIEQWNGTQWTVVSSPNIGSLNNGLNGVGGVAGTTHVRAVGFYNTSKGRDTLIESYC